MIDMAANNDLPRFHRLVSGFTVYECGVTILWLLGAGILLVAVGLVFGFAHSWGSGAEPWLPAFGMTGLAVECCGFPVAAYAKGQARRELAAGYTSSPGQHADVDWVDSRAGMVLREAGRPLFSSVAVKAAKRHARGYARQYPNVKQGWVQRRRNSIAFPDHVERAIATEDHGVGMSD